MVSKLHGYLRLFAVLVSLYPVGVNATDLIPNINSANNTYISLQAQPCNLKNKIDPNHPTASQADDVSCTVKRITDRFMSDLFYLMGAIAVLMLVYAGITYIRSNGDMDAAKKARQTIINVIAGIILLAASYAIIELISGAAHFFKP